MAIMAITKDNMTSVAADLVQYIPKAEKKVVAAGAKAAKPCVVKSAKKELHGDYSDAITDTSVHQNAAKKRGDGYVAYITFKGTRNDHNWGDHMSYSKKSRRMAEVAFVNEYGVKGKQKARKFMEKAIISNEDKIVSAMQKALEDAIGEL